MALHLTNRNVAHAIAGRIRVLIARQDDGDVTAAARRLDRPIADVYLPERLISCGNKPAALDFLADVLRGYEADACWLITGTISGTSRAQPPMSNEARVTILELLGELSDQLLDEARRDHPGAVAQLDAENNRGHAH